MKRLLLLLLIACATGPRVARSVDPREMIDLSTTGVALDLRYATTNNFMHTQLYPVAKAYLRAPVAAALADVERELAPQRLGLKVWDAYRPYRVTVAMWEPIKNPDYVADPKKGSRHNRGAAVDLTLIDLETGKELLMPTGFDDFTPRARNDFNDLPAEAIANRARLREVMTRHGFEPLPSEWWHYDFKGWEKFELLDVPLDSLAAAR
ncbi:MAG TPA: M15 family metallopeptidase [Thermoanaerobaculia bacterium]|jgi:D-alanyl-D-alanine dipeptidase